MVHGAVRRIEKLKERPALPSGENARAATGAARRGTPAGGSGQENDQDADRDRRQIGILLRRSPGDFGGRAGPRRRRYGLLARGYRAQPDRGAAPRGTRAADRRPCRHAPPGRLPALHTRARGASDNLCDGPRTGHRGHRRHLPGGGPPPAAGEAGPRRNARRGRSGRDPRQAGARRGGRAHGPGRRADDRHRDGCGPRPHRLHATDPLPLADHAEHRPLRAARRGDETPRNRPRAGTARRRSAARYPDARSISTGSPAGSMS